MTTTAPEAQAASNPSISRPMPLRSTEQGPSFPLFRSDPVFNTLNMGTEAATFFTRLHLPGDVIPDELMLAAGWTVVKAVEAVGTEPEFLRARVMSQIVAEWPNSVRLTYNEQLQTLIIWRHIGPPTTPASEPFPTAADVKYALHVLIAVGSARANAFADARPRSANPIALDRLAEAEQAHFEAVASALQQHPALPWNSPRV